MKKEFDDLLCEKYPKIFADRHAPKEKTAMCCGFDCGDGWFLLIDNMCGVIQDHIDNRMNNIENYKSQKATGNYIPVCNAKEISQVVAIQVKQKFGALRFYFDGGDEYIKGVVSLAEALSYFICERCGSMKNIGHTTSGFIETLCEECGKNDNTWRKYSEEE